MLIRRNVKKWREIIIIFFLSKMSINNLNIYCTAVVSFTLDELIFSLLHYLKKKA